MRVFLGTLQNTKETEKSQTAYYLWLGGGKCGYVFPNLIGHRGEKTQCQKTASQKEYKVVHFDHSAQSPQVVSVAVGSQSWLGLWVHGDQLEYTMETSTNCFHILQMFHIHSAGEAIPIHLRRWRRAAICMKRHILFPLQRFIWKPPKFLLTLGSRFKNNKNVYINFFFLFKVTRK